VVQNVDDGKVSGAVLGGVDPRDESDLYGVANIPRRVGRVEEDVTIDSVAGVVAENVGAESALVSGGLERDVCDESDIFSVLIVADHIVGSGLVALGDALVFDAPVGVAGLGVRLPPIGRGGGENSFEEVAVLETEVFDADAVRAVVGEARGTHVCKTTAENFRLDIVLTAGGDTAGNDTDEFVVDVGIGVGLGLDVGVGLLLLDSVDGSVVEGGRFDISPLVSGVDGGRNDVGVLRNGATEFEKFEVLLNGRRRRRGGSRRRVGKRSHSCVCVCMCIER